MADWVDKNVKTERTFRNLYVDPITGLTPGINMLNVPLLYKVGRDYLHLARKGKWREIHRGNMRFPFRGALRKDSDIENFRKTLKANFLHDQPVRDAVEDLYRGSNRETPFRKGYKVSIRCSPDPRPPLITYNAKYPHRLKIKLNSEDPQAVKAGLLISRYWMKDSRPPDRDWMEKQGEGLGAYHDMFFGNVRRLTNDQGEQLPRYALLDPAKSSPSSPEAEKTTLQSRSYDSVGQPSSPQQEKKPRTELPHALDKTTYSATLDPLPALLNEDSHISFTVVPSPREAPASPKKIHLPLGELTLITQQSKNLNVPGDVGKYLQKLPLGTRFGINQNEKKIVESPRTIAHTPHSSTNPRSAGR